MMKLHPFLFWSNNKKRFMFVIGKYANALPRRFEAGFYSVSVPERASLSTLIRNRIEELME